MGANQSGNSKIKADFMLVDLSSAQVCLKFILSGNDAILSDRARRAETQVDCIWKVVLGQGHFREDLPKHNGDSDLENLRQTEGEWQGQQGASPDHKDSMSSRQNPRHQQQSRRSTSRIVCRFQYCELFSTNAELHRAIQALREVIRSFGLSNSLSESEQQAFLDYVNTEPPKDPKDQRACTNFVDRTQLIAAVWFLLLIH